MEDIVILEDLFADSQRLQAVELINGCSESTLTEVAYRPLTRRTSATILDLLLPVPVPILLRGGMLLVLTPEILHVRVQELANPLPRAEALGNNWGIVV